MSICPVIQVLSLCEAEIASEDHSQHILENYGFKKCNFQKATLMPSSGT